MVLNEPEKPRITFVIWADFLNLICAAPFVISINDTWHRWKLLVEDSLATVNAACQRHLIVGHTWAFGASFIKFAFIV